MNQLTPKHKFLFSTFALIMAAWGLLGLYVGGAALCGGKVSRFRCSTQSGIGADFVNLLFLAAAVWAIAHMLKASGRIGLRDGLIVLYGVGALTYLGVKAF